MIPVLRAASVAFLACGLAAPATAQDPSPEMAEEALAYAWSNALYTMYHEIGHMFVDQFALPVLSREEDAVDNLATLMVLEDFSESGDRVLEDAAYGWALSEAWESEGELTDDWFYDEHSLDQQRAFSMVCLLVGSDAEAFGETADEWGLAPERQESCAFDHAQAEASWAAVLEPFRHEGEAGGEVGEPMIEVIYDEPEEGLEDIAAMLAEREILETAALRVEEAYALPAAVAFRATSCGEDNAYYDPSVPEVTLCYEHAQGHFDRYLEDLMANDEWDDAEDEVYEEMDDELE